METKASADGSGNIAVTTSLSTTGVIDMRAARAAFVRSSADITVTPYTAREGKDYKAIKLDGSTGSDYTIDLVDEWQPLDADLFSCHFLKLVGDDTAEVEVMLKA